MRGLVQRVEQAWVDARVDGEWIRSGEIGPGLLVLIGVTHSDTEQQAKRLADKLWNLRVMSDDNGVMNKSVAETTRSILVVSQFTLYGDTNSGRRPSWIAAARPEEAEPLIEIVVAELEKLGAQVATGRFRTDMKVGLVNDGPCTVIVDV
ncbi:MAG: D-aminoacyl-tRNA deacylase [Actinomycetota bacterium]